MIKLKATTNISAFLHCSSVVLKRFSVVEDMLNPVTLLCFFYSGRHKAKAESLAGCYLPQKNNQHGFDAGCFEYSLLTSDNMEVISRELSAVDVVDCNAGSIGQFDDGVDPVLTDIQ